MQVHYTGTLEDGSVFDSSLEREPLEFEIGGGKVIPGFDDAVMGLAEGEKRKQLVPAERAYGKYLLVAAAALIPNACRTVCEHTVCVRIMALLRLLRLPACRRIEAVSQFAQYNNGKCLMVIYTMHMTVDCAPPRSSTL